MADTKNKSSEPVNEPVVETKEVVRPLVAVQDTDPDNGDPNLEMQAEIEKPVGVGQNLYFFPDIQKSVVANSFDEAVDMVQSDLDAFKKSTEDNQ